MSSLRILPLVVALLFGWVGGVQAQSLVAAGFEDGRKGPAGSPGGWELELEIGRFLARGDTDSESGDALYGGRARRWLTDRWAVDLGVRLLDVDEAAGESVDVYFIDLATRHRIFDGERIDLVVFGGPGLFREKFREGPQSVTFDELTVHAGLGARIALGPRGFLRPEVRGRWIDGVFDDDVHAEVGVSFGIGLGSRSD